MRSGKDYYEKWDKAADQMLQEADTEDKPAAVPGVRGAGIDAAAAAGGPTTTGARGPVLTRKQIEVNAALTPKEREWQAEQEKVKGNEHFR